MQATSSNEAVVPELSAAERLCATWGVHPDAWLTRKETAKHTEVAFNTLENMAARRVGPRYRVALSKARYLAFKGSVSRARCCRVVVAATV
jgi:hypothetical protein